MKKIKILSLFVCLLVLFTACHDEEDKPNYGSRTVLVYIAGDNSLSGFANEDLNEMIEGMQERWMIVVIIYWFIWIKVQVLN